MSSQSFEKTALVTGASSGLGAEFARQLAALGFNLILTSRRTERLQQLGEHLRTTYSIRVQIQLADLSMLSDIENLISIINNLEALDLLINNAGFGTVGRFHRVDAKKEMAMVSVHMVAPVMLSRAVLPGMIARNQGGIINVSSLAGLIPIRNVLYHSSKAFLISFSEALHTELYASQVHVQALCPGFILTEFHDTIEYSRFSRKGIPRFLWMTSGQVVSASLKSLPHGKLLCIPGGINRFAGALARNSLSAGLIKYAAMLVLFKRKPS